MPSMYFPQSNVGFVPAQSNQAAATQIITSGQTLPATGIGTVLKPIDFFSSWGLSPSTDTPPVAYPSRDNPLETNYAAEARDYQALLAQPAENIRQQSALDKITQAFTPRQPVDVPKVQSGIEWKPVAVVAGLAIGAMMLLGKK